MKRLKPIFSFLYALFAPMVSPILLILCIFQFCKIAELKRDVALYQKDIDTMTTDINAKDTKYSELEDANMVLNLKYNYAGGLNDYLMTACEGVYQQLKQTTDVLESTSRCAYFKQDPKHCGVDATDLALLIHKNRHLHY